MEKLNRSVWKTSMELAEEFGYHHRDSIAHITQVYKIPKIKGKKTSSFYYNRDKFIETPPVIKRLLQAEDIEKYNKELRPKGDFMLFGDVHIPFHDDDLLEKMMAIARKFGIKRGVIPGDLLEMDIFKTYPDKHVAWHYEKTKTRQVLTALLSWFDLLVWLIGNHELRMWKRLQGMGEEEDVFEIVLTKEMLDHIKYSIYPYAIINDSWMVCHPKSYSRIQARNPYFLGSKYLVKLIEEGKGPNDQYGIVAYHGHLGGEGTDISARFQVADGMTMVDPEKVMYQQIKIDTSPKWRPGFAMLLNNYLYRFPKDTTDWNFWLK